MVYSGNIFNVSTCFIPGTSLMWAHGLKLDPSAAVAFMLEASLVRPYGLLLKPLYFRHMVQS